MGRTIENKQKIVTEIKSLLDDSEMAVVLDYKGCLLYTSDAADDLLCVDLGGRRIIAYIIIQQRVNFLTDNLVKHLCQLEPKAP